MPGVANGQSCHAMRRSVGGRDLHRLPANYLTKTEIPIDNDEHAAIADDASVSIWLHLPRAQPSDVFRNANHAVRVMAHEARIDEVSGHDLGFAGF